VSPVREEGSAGLVERLEPFRQQFREQDWPGIVRRLEQVQSAWDGLTAEEQERLGACLDRCWAGVVTDVIRCREMRIAAAQARIGGERDAG